MLYLSIFFISWITSCKTTSPQTSQSDEQTAEDDAQKEVPVPLSMWSPSQRESNAKYLYLIGEMKQLRSESDQALALFEAAYNLDPNSFLGLKYISSKALISDPKEAFLEAKRMALLYPHDASIQFLYASIALMVEDQQAALETFKKTIQIDPKFEQAYFQIARIYQTKKQTKVAIQWIRQVIKQNPENVFAWTFLSRLYMTINDRKEALVAAKRAHDLSSNNPEVSLIYAIALEINKRSQEAVQLYENVYRSTKIGVAQDELLTRMVEIYREFGDLKQALALLDEVLEKAMLVADDKSGGSQSDQSFNNHIAIVGAQKAVILWELKRFDEATKLLADLSQKYPASDRLHYLTGISLEREKKYLEAIAHYEKIASDSPLVPFSKFRSALLLKEMSKDPKNPDTEALKKSELFAKEVLDHPEINQDAYLLLAEVYADQRLYSKAIDLLADSIAKFPDNSRMVFFKGVFEEKNNQYKDAVKSMRRVIELDPKNSSAYNYLGYMFAERGENLKEAIKLILEALKLKPDDGFYLDSLGWAYFQNGQLKEAKETLEKALQKAPDEGIILEHLGDVFEAEKNHEKAQELFKSALGKKIEEKDRLRIEKKIKS